jgi:acyl carrier protein
VLDEKQRAVPVGVNGELYIAGAGLARGYLGRPEQTAERFVPDPYSCQAGARMYRSGDKCRQRQDGLLEYLSRLDDQVKVRGYRIELGEVEGVLLEHKRVKEAAAVVWQEAEGEARLIGYVVFDEAGSVTKTELRSHMRDRLPEWMVPGVFIELEQMPVTVSGKVDRRSLLAAQGREMEGDGSEYQGPQTAMEERLARIWGEALGVEMVSVEENFFDLGGHSLMAVRVVRQVSREIGKPLGVVKLFEHPTIRRLAAELEAEANVANVREAEGREANSEQWAAKRRQALRRQRGMVRSIS